MVVINRNRNTALAVRRTGRAVLMIIMRSGKLTTSYVQHKTFQTDWREIEGSLDRALTIFIEHAEKSGATLSAKNALKKMVIARDTASLRLF